MEASLPFTPVIILGAGRSGTNALRNMITSLDGFSTWPCDEINAIWRHGNANWDNDEFPVEFATPKVISYIRKSFYSQWQREGKPIFLVEKTCANTLRVEYVNRILPEAKYIHIIRNGADVVSSAEKRWKGQLEVQPLHYFISKARFVPVLDIPLFIYRFIKNRYQKILGRSERLTRWGPIPVEAKKYENNSLTDVCAHQWVQCVQKCEQGLNNIDQCKILVVRYEELVANPSKTLDSILKFLPCDEHSLAFDDKHMQTAVDMIKTNVRTTKSTDLDINDPFINECYKKLIKRLGY